jgi:glycosyltransferase involved in cell wall biosynthesis
VPPGDATALATAIRTLSGDPKRRKSLGEAARADAVENLEAARVLREFERASIDCCVVRGGERDLDDVVR